MSSQTSTAGVESKARQRLDKVCRGLALVGGVALVIIMVVIMGSVVGAQFGKPILGDTEIVDQLTGILVFTFLPYCHLHGGNVMVDFFTRPLPKRANQFLDSLMNVVFALVAAVITWRLMVGGVTAYTRDNRSMFLNLPEWVVYAVGSIACVLWIIVILFVAWEHGMRAAGRSAASSTDAHTFG